MTELSELEKDLQDVNNKKLEKDLQDVNDKLSNMKNTIPEPPKQEMMPKITAAAEVHKHIKKKIIIGIMGIAGIALSGFFSTFHKWAGAGSAAVMVIPLAIMIGKDIQLRKHLEENYGLK